MSSIFQQEQRKPAPKSPIPRSRSDFNYVGLTSKEKRWTTDFSLLLPAFSRDSTGYSRLTETPVTLQPRTKSSNHKLTKSSTLDSGTICNSHCSEPKTHVQSPCNADTADGKFFPQPVVCCKSKHPFNSIDQPCRQHVKPEVSIRRSPTMDPKVLTSSPCKVSNVICRSPTLDPTILTRSPKEANRWPPSVDARGIAVNRSPLCGGENSTSEVVRSQSLRSLRRPSDKSPTKLRTSESAQSDVTGSALKPSTVVEADELEDEEDLRRLRHFSVTPKGLINWGDSFRSHSLTSVHPASNDGSQWDVASTRSYPMATSNSQWSCNKVPLRYKVAIMGLEEVGKTSLIRQFQTSEYICAFDTSYDVSNDYVITVILNEEESELEFLEYRCPDEEDEKPDKEADIPLADAHVIVYSVTNRRSFLRALDLLTVVQRTFRRSAVLLVGNKSDLVRVRAVTTDEGQTSAKEKGTSFIETSAAINHQVDELLVSILAQIRTKTKSSSSSGRWSGPNSSSSLSKAKGLIKKFLKKACFQSKSCDNLQRL